MPRRDVSLLGILILMGLLVAGCAGSQGPEGPVGPAGPAGPAGPPGPAGENATARQTYVGSERCGGCHQDVYDKFVLSGHPYDITQIEDGQPPTFPYDDVTGGVTESPEGYTWDDISYVIGGYGWMARFVDQNGFVITGDENATTQYNFANETVGTEAGWVAYHSGEEVATDCGACHTTGYNPDGRQEAMEGIVGSWALAGVQCEECHGPGSGHADDPFGITMNIDPSSQLCGDCHYRQDPAQIAAEDGFIMHNQQFDELFNSKHFALSCITCHDPHASATYSDPDVNPNQGIRQQCDTCHWQKTYQNNRLHLGVQVRCVDCHMPPMDKSAVANADTFTGDILAHQFSINPDPNAPQFSEDGTLANPYITLTYACMHCHNGETASAKDMETLATMASGYHTAPTPTPEPSPTPESEVTPTPQS